MDGAIESNMHVTLYQSCHHGFGGDLTNVFMSAYTFCPIHTRFLISSSFPVSRVAKVHLFGASLGGFLAQKFAECTYKSPRVHSLILCNSFSDTSIFNQTWAANRYIAGDR